MMIEVKVSDLKFNPMEAFSSDWMLLTAGNKENGYNTMTIAWGQLGALWQNDNLDSSHLGIPTATVFVRPQRYTKAFMDREDFYTVALYDKAFKKNLAYLGSHSGREENKVKKLGLSPVFVDGTTYIAGAKLVLFCKKLYQAPILDAGFVDQKVKEKTYPLKDYHTMYIGEIVRVLVDKSALKELTTL